MWPGYEALGLGMRLLGGMARVWEVWPGYEALRRHGPGMRHDPGMMLLGGMAQV